MCAGDGRDVIGVLQSDCQRKEVEAYLVELNGQSVTAGIQRAKASGLENVIRFIHADATDYSTYRDLAPFDIVLVCGVWGHVPAQDRAKLIRALASLCKPGASVIWTLKISQGEHRLAEVRSQFDEACWSPVRQVLTPDKKSAVCTYVYRGATLEVPANGQIFSFREKAG